MRSKFIHFTSVSLTFLLMCSACKKDNNSNATPPPHISSFYPQSGVRGTAVLIGGSNFSTVLAENKVSFNGKEARLISTTGTSLMVEVPVTAGTGKIAVTVGNHTDSSASSFNYQAAVSFVAGSQTNGSIDGKAADAQFAYPGGIAFDKGGNLFIASGAKIRRLGTDNIVSTFAGVYDYGYQDGPAATSKFYGPTDIVPDAAGNLYVSDSYNHCIRKIAADGTVSTLAGKAGLRDFIDGAGATARFNYPHGITIDQTGNLYVADGNNCIRKVTPAGVVSVFAGTITKGYQDGTGIAARFSGVYDVTADAAGNIYVTDQGNYRIRKITPAGVVTTVAGTGVSGYKDGPKDVAEFGYLTELCLDKSGHILVCDMGNKVLRKITPSGEVTTIAGIPDGTATIGPASKASFPYLNGIAVAPSGLIWFADQYGIKTFY